MTASSTSIDQSQLQAALRCCAQVARKRARNFYYGLKLLPQPQRSAMYSIYAWMRAADDLVDEAQATGEYDSKAIAARIAEFGALTDEALQQRPAHQPLWIALADAARRFPLSAEHFHMMLQGQLEDLQPTSYETFDELRSYCYRVASVVGLLCIEVWGYSDVGAKQLAIDRGIAFQLTNILRDYRQDFDCGRVYLPREDFVRHGLTPDDLRNWSKPAACQAMILQQVQRAQGFYERSAPLERMIPPRSRPTLWAMTAIYRRLLTKISKNPSRLVLGKRVRVNSLHKAGIALRARLS